jgi:hypothetical protein
LVIEQFLSLLNVILDQNYFEHDNTFFKQVQGLAMGAPTFHLFSEMYLKWLEHNEIKKKKFARNSYNAYFRYVNDILIIYNNRTY